MKNITEKDRQNGFRWDAFMLAFLIFMQSIFPMGIWAKDGNFLRINPMAAPVMDKQFVQYPSDEATIPDKVEDVEQPTEAEVMAIPGGPGQPEVQAFTPVDAKDMVDLFTGDFSYNIPLLDVDGYPINLSYNAGVGMEQEASWVGLGWNLNPGVINRQMRGIPDDFNGTDLIVQDYNQKPNWTVGTTVGFNYELFAVDLSEIPGGDDGGLGLSATLGVEYNNYMGYGADFTIGPSFNIAKKIGFECGLQFTGSSQGGATIGTHASLSDGNKKSDRVVNKLTIGSAFNSRQGLQQVSVNVSQERNFIYEKNMMTGGKISDHENVGGQLGGSFNFGMSSFVPQIPFDTKSRTFTARFKLSADLVGNDPAGSFSGFFSRSSLTSNSKTVSAFGYANLERGQNSPYAMMDFNRENDASFTKNTPALPIPHLMYDVFSVRGQGVSGSYRMDRKDIGYVFDPRITSSSDSYSLGGEVGLGLTFKAGIDVGGTAANGSSGVWKDGNNAARSVRYISNTNFFRDASELAYDESDAEFQNIGGPRAVYFPLNGSKGLSQSLKNANGDVYSPTNRKSLKFRRNQPLSSFTVAEVKNGFGPTKLPPSAYAANQSSVAHHTGAFTVTKTDGSRYYYGLPAFNKIQRNVSFAVGDGKTAGLVPDWNTRLVSYSAQDASIGNNRGLDNHFNAQTIPGYAHSYLLTAVLDADYVDSDEIPGPSRNDLGTYVEFKYRHVQQYKWRNPVNASQAFHDRGLNADPTDDKANYIYGEKELWYLDTVKTKNHLLIFYTSDRKDEVSVNSETGGISAGNARMQKLDSLKLYSLVDFYASGPNALPIKTVHFRYDYRLCRNYPGNLEAGSSDTLRGGKLTLSSVYFTYEKSYRGEKAPYKFFYDYNPDYNANNVDRWGTYRPNPGLTGDESSTPLSNAVFPYVGYNEVDCNRYAASWNLNRINLPSGAMMVIDYEADDYAFVQHKRAKQMFKIVGVEGCTGSECSISDEANKNRKIFFELIPFTNIDDYGAEGDVIYFRSLLSMDQDASHFDYVPGYAKIKEIGMEGSNGYIKLEPGKLKDSEPASYNPMAISGVQFARNYLQRIIPPSSQENPQSETADFLDIAMSLIGAFASFGELFTGPNKPIWNKHIGTILVKDKSWIRLNNPNYRKLGGGHRVREIRTYDNWGEMVDVGEDSYYGTTYLYNFEGKSSGVASYEPQIGGEENVWRNYVANDIKMTWAPDIRNYMETPFGEQFFPTPSVGYGKVLVKNLEREGVKRTATGYTVSEYYTAKDFPTITERTPVETKPSKYNLNLLLYSKTEDIMAASQGFVIENNDMHGKPKAIEVYAEGQAAPYSTVRYHYQSSARTIDGIAANQLDNNVKVITPEGTFKNVVVGRTYEAVADFRENKSEMEAGNLGINLNYTLPFVVVPMILGANYSKSKTEFRSAVFAKTIERKGILYKTIAEDYNSRIETENLLFDSETGEVLLTSVNNAFRDTVYNFTYPAHWIYDGMGQAYRNLGYTSTVSTNFVDGYTSTLSSANLVEGDEVMVKKAASYLKGWVTESGPLGVRIMLKDGTPLVGAISYLKVIRSGNRNLQSTAVGSITLKKNPLNTLGGNVFHEVLDAQSVEYGDAWKTYCDCSDSLARQNPYVTGLKGKWTPKTDYLHLSDRTQTFENNNTDIREDGLMNSFTPFFKLAGGKWSVNKADWTYSTTISQSSPYGDILENVDALGRYSNMQMGYNQSLVVAASANAMLKESGFNSFEDYGFASCPDDHFRFGTENDLSHSDAHTGRFSINVTAGHPVLLEKQIAEVCQTPDPCDFSSYISGETTTVVRVMDVDGVQMSFETIYGEPTPLITEIAGGIQLSFSSSAAFRVEVKLIKPNGCSTIIPIVGL